MAYNYEYPYTDAQRYNDDWLINKVKELAMDWLKTSGEWTETQEAWEELKRYITDYFNNLDVQEEINEKLEAMKADGSLFNIIKPLFDEYQQGIDVLSARMDVLSARMDTFTALGDGATTGDAELADIRVDYTGHTWPNAGDAFRGVTGQLSSDLADLSKYGTKTDRDIIKIELVNKNDVTDNKYYFDSDGKLVIGSGSACYLQNEPIRLYANRTYKIQSVYWDYCFICEKDTKNILGKIRSLGQYADDVVTLTTTTTDVDLYITYTEVSYANTTIYQDFTNDLTVNPLIKHSKIFDIVVDINGTGDFTDIQSAIDYAKNTYDVNTIPITIFVKNGIYNVIPTEAYPFYAIDKGSNRINIKGESRDGVIIRCTCTSTRQGITLNIGGRCTIENLTIENIADSSYTSDTVLEGNHRPYCIHNDSGSGETSTYYTTVSNCKLYSECDTPIGAGMHNNQIQRYVNCELIYSENAVIKQQGALYVHTPIDTNAIAKGLEVVDCILISENSSHALSTPNVTGSQSWNEIPQTYIRNVTYSKGTELYLGGANGIVNYSKGNTNDLLNR